MKKLLAVLLVLCLFVGMMPMMAFATDDVADTQQENFENTDVLNEGSPGDPSGNSDPSGGDQIGGDQSGGDQSRPGGQGQGNDTGKGYDADNIQSVKQLEEALKDNDVPEIHIGASMDFTDDLTISREVTIKGGPFNGPGTIKIEADVEFVDVVVNTDVEVASGKTLTLSNEKATSTIDPNKISGEGKVVVNEEVIHDGTNTGTEPGGDDDEQEVPVEPVYFNVSFTVKPYWAEVVVTDSTGEKVYPVNGQYWLEADKTYTYTVSAYGFTSKSGTITSNDARDTFEVTLTQSERVVVWPTSHGDVYFSYLSHGWVAVYTEPDSGYYLDDLTVKMSGGATFTPYHYEGNVYYFRLHGETATVYATFKALPDEYRVYIANTEHGSVSVDTRYAEEGEWVYITVNPNAGYRLSDLTVTRPSGNTVKVEHVRGNVFRFAMPGVRVTVDAEFVRTTMPFTDVSRGQWFYDAVSFVYWRDIMDGVTSTQFAPDATTTRAMVVQILYRMAGSPTVRGSSPFYDVSNGAWYADAVIWAEANDIVNGMTTTTFAPNTAVTREQLATMLYRYAQYRHYNTSAGANTNILSYYDANRISEYAFSALQWACGEGIMDGTGTGYLSPQGQATRAQLAAMLMRFCMEYRI